jgi:predicted ATPase
MPCWQVDLAPLASSALVATTVLSAVGDGNDRSVDAAEAIVAALASREGVILLDNCEHVVDGARAVAAVVSASTRVMVLATSQVTLGVEGEQLVPLGAMTLPDPADDAATIAASDAVRLLAARARQHNLEFELTAEVAPTVGELCRQLDGLPLALELAAAHLALLGPAAMLERVRAGRLGLLADGLAGGSRRHAGLASALDWSYDLLDEPARALLQRLAVFSGGFTVAAAEAVCAGGGLESSDVYPTLARLARRSLVAQRARGNDARYWLLETVREYASAKLAAGGASSDLDVWTMVREGVVWAFGCGSRVARIADTKGIGYLAVLVGRPGVEVHVTDLVGGGAVATSPQSVSDHRSIREYRARLAELADELEEARANNDLERTAALDAEVDALEAAVTASVGGAGREREFATSVERARMSVTKALRGAIQRIAAELPELGSHLDRSVRTGRLCSYGPSADESVTLRPGP